MPNKGVLTVAYKRDVQLDEGYYLTRHAEIIERVLVPLGLERTEMRKIPAAADSPAPPPIHLERLFSVGPGAPGGPAEPGQRGRLGDIPNYYQGAPDIFVGEVLG